MRRGKGSLKLSEYYDWGFYDDRLSPAEKRSFMSEGLNRKVDRLLNHPEWRALTDNKLLTYGFLKGLGLPTPEVYAVYHPAGRDVGTVRCCRTPEELADFLRTGMRYPFFTKALSFNVGKGASSVRSLDRERDLLQLADGNEVGVDQYVSGLTVLSPEIRKTGYIFQERIVQHPEIERICGTTAATVRVVILLYDDGPRLFRTVWRIPVGGNIVDNFQKGKSGNLAARVNPESGVVERVIRARNVAEDGPAIHPDSGAQLLGITLPNWKQSMETCLAAASTLPGLRYQHWDMAFGPTGPILLEVNYEGGCDVLQMTGPPGLLDDQFLTFLDRYGTEHKLTK